MTIREWLGRSFSVVENDDPVLCGISRRVHFVRHPLSRLRSAFRFLYWMEDYGRPTKSGAVLTSWRDFVDDVLSGKPKNEHWELQYRHVGDVPNIVHRLEDIGHWFTVYRPGLLPWVNRSSPVEGDDEQYRVGDIMKMYEKDFDLWEGADRSWPL